MAHVVIEKKTGIEGMPVLSRVEMLRRIAWHQKEMREHTREVLRLKAMWDFSDGQKWSEPS